jgi:putative peptidoglycan lipid II flippase
LAFAGARVLAFAFYALKNTRLPVIVAACAMVANVILSLLLMGPLRQGGLALASSLSSALNMVVLWILLEGKIGGFGLRSIAAAALRMCIVSVVMGVIVYVLALLCEQFAGTTTLVGRLVHVLIPLTGGVTFYFGTSFALGWEESVQLMQALKRRGRGQ